MIKLPKYKYLFAAADLFVISLTLTFSAYTVRNNYAQTLTGFIKDNLAVLIPLLFLSLIIIFIFQLNGLYRINVILSRQTHLFRIIKALIYSAATVSIFSFIIPETSFYNRLLVIPYMLSSFVLLYAVRTEMLRWYFMRFSSRHFKRNIVIIGKGKSGMLLASRLSISNPYGLNILGYVSDREDEKDNSWFENKRVLGNINELKSIVNENKVDEILVAVDDIGYNRLMEILDFCAKQDITSVKLVSELFGIVPRKIATESYAGIPVVNVCFRYNSRFVTGMKRVTDLAASVLGIIILLPLLMTIAVLVKLSSPGPVLYTQMRIGKNGKPFRFYKFRSMYEIKGEDEDRKKMMLEFMKHNKTNGSDTKIVNDRRITRIGGILRKTSLDELPQLLNVIRGEMSLVGPRPCVPYEFDNYDEWQKRRVEVLPGCTGVWQISGRSSISFNDSVVLDIYYINNMSPLMDIEVLLKTLPVMLFSRGGR